MEDGMDKNVLLNKFVQSLKSNNFSNLAFRKLMNFSFEKEEVCDMVVYLESTYSNQIRCSVFELLVKSGLNAVELFEKYFSNELNTSAPGKIMDLATEIESPELILSIYSKYPSLSTAALMKLKKMKKYDSMAPFLFSEDLSLANLANQILSKSEN